MRDNKLRPRRREKLTKLSERLLGLLEWVLDGELGDEIIWWRWALIRAVQDRRIMFPTNEFLLSFR